ncbi:BREX-1 system adenine-specific DNA-methyltransferase PglX [Erysipelothrix rhusiopathiae]|nr:BREX-1 system adenine-specific DNA-methyltransferase PglX [Erysipelothrix rhusiopathiae]
MNKTAIKNFAVWARKELIEKSTQRAKIYGIEKNQEMTEMDTALNGQILTKSEKNARTILIDKIKKDGFDQTIEEVAYTWFNRIIALRFMEVNGYLPSHIRVFSSEDNEFEPQILSEAIHIELDGLDQSKVLDLYNAGNKEEELFSYLLITQCNALNQVLPGMFQKINDYTELLLPDGLLREGSVIDSMIKDIPEEDWKEQVQIIGWLYQYYNEERKDEVINIYKGNVSKEDIPAATQVFTTDWVVRYIVDNSLGRYWIERNPQSGLRDKLEFFIDSKDGQIQYVDEKIDPRELRVLDNCVGSGHFLLYEFDVLMEIYKEYGYREREAVEFILQDNLYGLDIDERARQLAYFSLMMKARSYSRRILTKEIEPNLYAIPESNNVNKEYIDLFGSSLTIENRTLARKSIEELLSTFKDGKNFGSIIPVDAFDYDLCKSYIDDVDHSKIDIFTYDAYEFQKQITTILKVAQIMAMKYHVVATNPPYLNRMNGQLKEYVDKHYKDYKTDLFSVFMYRNFELCGPGGYSGFMTPFVWMFIKSYEKLREYIIKNKSITSLIQMEYSAFEEATVPICSFVLKNSQEDSDGLYFRLSEFTGGMEVQKKKVLEAIANPNCGYFYETSQSNFEKIPGMPIAYWASDNIIKAFENGILMGEVLDVKQGLATADNNRFLRLWHEVEEDKCKYDSNNAEELIESKKKWIPYNKGGQRRQWYGNYDYLVNWENDGYEIRNFSDDKGNIRSRPQNTGYYFKEAITWSDITSGKFAIRYRIPGGIHDIKGMSAFYNGKENLKYMLGLTGTPITNYIFKMLNPTISLQVGNFKNFPVITDKELENAVIERVDNCVDISKLDWDMHETSWDFKGSPLSANKTDGLIKSAYESYKSQVNERFTKLKENEEELNRIFIEIYGLEDELSPDVADKDITVAKIFDKKEDIDETIKGNRYIMTREDVVKNFLSYFVGCLMGRYSLDEEGLAYAGGDFDLAKYSSFKADVDGVLPLTDAHYFEEDIVETFIQFLKVTFGEEHLNENLNFIASELKGKQTDSSRDKIRNYFLGDFYSDHCKMYQKLPIYWQYDSGKNNACKGLFYLHRYDKDTFARIRINYVFEIQDRYKQELARLETKIDGASASERVALQKEADALKKKILESQTFEEKIQHLADSYIAIDLDDGVAENYKIFKDVLTKIK